MCLPSSRQSQSLGQEDPLEKEMATYSNVLAWEIPCTEVSGRPQSMEKRVGHNLVTKQQQHNKYCKNISTDFILFYF